MNNTTRTIIGFFVAGGAFIAGRMTGTIAAPLPTPAEESRQVPECLTAAVTFDKKDRDKRNDSISFSTVMSYRDAYNQHPIMRDPQTNLIVKGFTIDAKGVQIIRDSLRYRQIYIRLGRKPNGHYTMMLLPLDANGNLVQNGTNPGVGANYDNLEPCPDECPKNFQQEEQHDQK
jgi:hypothetical protein